MLSSHRIAKTLRNILSLSLAPLASACGTIDTDGFDPVACVNPGEPSVLEGLKLEAPADYIELREIAMLGGSSHRTIESTGTLCATATDKLACKAKVDAATSTLGFQLGDCVDFCPSQILVVTSGDEVTILDTEASMKSFVLPVDAPADAVLMASLAGYSVICEDSERGGVRTTGKGYEVVGLRYTATCDPIEITRYLLSVDESGNVKELESEIFSSESGSCIGRRPAGLLHRAGKGATRVGAYLAKVAELEAASIHAFEALRRELIHHGAPQSLIDRAAHARRDEVRHARVMRRAAQRYGGLARAPRMEHRPPRSLEEIAIENAVEGCIRETFGALIGMWQARFARDPEIRQVMERIARDETRHATLAWAVDEWIRPRLSADAQKRLEEAQACALEEISEEARRGYDPELVMWAGMPNAAAAKELARNFKQTIA